MFNFLKISSGVRDLARQMVENPHDWEQGDYYFENKTCRDIRLRTSNGSFGMQLDGNHGFTYAEKQYLNNVIKQSIANKLLIKATK